MGSEDNYFDRCLKAFVLDLKLAENVVSPTSQLAEEDWKPGWKTAVRIKSTLALSVNCTVAFLPLSLTLIICIIRLFCALQGHKALKKDH